MEIEFFLDLLSKLAQATRKHFWKLLYTQGTLAAPNLNAGYLALLRGFYISEDYTIFDS